MLIETLILSLIIGKFNNGKIKNLNQIHIKGWYALIFAFALEVISLWVFANNAGDFGNIIVDVFPFIQFLVYILLIFVLVLNINKKGIKTITIGTILNFIPIVANNGKMPVSKTALIRSNLYNHVKLLENNEILTHVLAKSGTRLYYLSDIISIPKPYPFPKVVSIGDIILSIGIFLLIQYYMKDINI